MRKLATLLVWAISVTANAAQWQLITTSTDLKKVTYWFVDPDSVVKESNITRAKLRTAWSETQFSPDNTGYRSTTYTSYIDCDRRLLAYTANTYFSDFESLGDPVHEEPEYPVEALSFSPARAGTPGEMRINYLCKNYEGGSSLSI